MLALAFALLVLSDPPVREQCSVIMPHPSGQGVTYQPAPGFSVAKAALPLSLPAGFENVNGVACAREHLTITDNDFRVLLDLGLPMYIGGDGLMGVLELADGQFQFRLLRGALSEEQGAMVQAALDRGQVLARAHAD